LPESGKTELECSECHEAVVETDTFCPHCGSLFSDTISCKEHPGVRAEGVCVICVKPCCKLCGEITHGIFLCNEHFQYEVVEGMARVHGTTDNVQSQYIAECLEEAGFHPFLYSRMFHPDSGEPAVAMLPNISRSSRTELKLLVPFREVIEAETFIKNLERT
jgi:hypothetical protein